MTVLILSAWLWCWPPACGVPVDAVETAPMPRLLAPDARILPVGAPRIIPPGDVTD